MRNQSEKRQKIFLYAFILSGVAIAIFVFINNRSLWLDEARLANNTVNRGFIKLLSPLDRNQVAPIGFLYVERLMVVFLGKKDWVLRIFPLLSFLLSIPLFYSINSRLFKSNLFALFSCGIFSLTASLLMYSSEVKQYSSDVLVGLSITWLALNFSKSKDKNSFILYVLGGALAVWFSNIAVIMLFTMGIYSWYTTYVLDRKNLFLASIPIVFWLISFFIYYFLFIHNHANQASMIRYWRGSFLPQNIFTSDFYVFLFDKTKMIFSSLLGFSKLWVIPFMFFLLGIVLNLKSKKILFLTLFPLLLHLVLSSFYLYPFDKRLILYLSPFIIVFYAQGIWSLFCFLNERNKVIGTFFLAIPLALNFYVASKSMPFEHEEIKASLKYINNNIRPNSMIYVNHRAISAFEFYKNNYPRLETVDSIVYSTSKPSDWSKLDDQILKFLKFENFWLLFSRVYKDKEIGLTDEKYIIDKLETHGYSVMKESRSHRSSAYEVEK